MSKAILESKKLQSEAARLLKKMGLVEVLESYGELMVTGSFKYQVMLAPDIDLNVIVKKIYKEKINEFVQGLLAKNYTSVKVVDFTNNRKELADNPVKFPPKGYFVQIKTFYAKKLWCIAIFFLNKPQAEAVEYEKFFEKADLEIRVKIIEFKKRLLDLGKKVPSKYIYDAVFKSAVNNFEELKEYLENEKV